MGKISVVDHLAHGHSRSVRSEPCLLQRRWMTEHLVADVGFDAICTDDEIRLKGPTVSERDRGSIEINVRNGRIDLHFHSTADGQFVHGIEEVSAMDDVVGRIEP